MPTAFTPNKDGINDVIYVRGWGIESLKEFKIFNRAGDLIYQTSDIYEGWDGTYNGKDQPDGTYIYLVIVYSYDGTERTKTGSIRLIR